jgi:uncharacterized protein (TIGR03435 family)
MSELSMVAKATFILASALVATRLARGSAASRRALILTSAFGVLLAMPLTELMSPVRPVAVPLPAISTAVVLSDPSREPSVPAPASTATVDASSPSASGRVEIIAAVRGVWFAGVLIVAIRLGFALRRLSQLRRSGERWTDETAQAILRQATSRRVHLFLHGDLGTPMTCGILRPAIGLPLDACNWPAPELRQVLIHEAEHIRRGDWLVQLLARLVTAAYWFHPLAWVAARRLHLECEHACDDAVVRAGERTAYAQQLVSMARRLSERPSTSALAMADRRDLARRVDAVLSTARPRGAVGLRAAAVTVAVALLVALAIAPWRAVAAQSTSLEDVLQIPTALTGRRFDNVTIRSGDRQGPSGASFDAKTGRLIAHNVTLQWLISQAYAPVPLLEFVREEPYELNDTRVTGGPEWIERDTFNVEATAELPVTAEDLRAMLRQLLFDSFDLFVRVEKQEKAAYRLVRARDDGRVGPGLKSGEESCAERWKTEGGGPGQIVRRCTTLATFAADFTLVEALGRPVIDRTGLSGLFDVTLSYTPTREELSTIWETSLAELPPEVLARPSVFAAFEQQLGLRLESTRAATYTLAVDHAARPAQAPSR